ncbi:hypothetical protein TRFO_41386 [Tritrichomonas foetus]|uniref:Ion transport domain-containing protein n=1 Tax=Tritrichomonas foetus TaxID=1144522 RepID=A0A1J4L0Q1_9EUKA|nr:hypothetical protein TRFO_41386 [Tritrichomonas foetus]|eukprot:OHT16986.1 hypothetical protein TRFO_41386 [Tritrichomonas foetus]
MREIPVIEIEEDLGYKPKNFCKIVIRSTAFKWMMIFIIVAEVCFTIFKADFKVKNQRTKYHFKLIQIFFTFIFLTEFCLKFLYKPHKYFQNNQYLIEFISLILSFIVIFLENDQNILPFIEAIQSIRILRIFFINKKIKELFYSISRVTFVSFPSILILIVFILIFSFIGNYLFEESSLFNNAFYSMLIVFDISTKDSWPTTSSKLLKVYPNAVWMPIVIILIIGTVLSSIVVAQVTDEVASTTEKSESKKKKKQIKKVGKLLKKYNKSQIQNEIEFNAEIAKLEIPELDSDYLDKLPPPLPKRSPITTQNFIKALKVTLEHNINDMERRLELQSALISRLKHLANDS